MDRTMVGEPSGGGGYSTYYDNSPEQDSFLQEDGVVGNRKNGKVFIRTRSCKKLQFLSCRLISLALCPKLLLPLILSPSNHQHHPQLGRICRIRWSNFRECMPEVIKLQR